MSWVDSKKIAKCCEAGGTDKHRLYHCDELREERKNMPDVVRSCEMKARSGNEKAENWQRMERMWMEEQ